MVMRQKLKVKLTFKSNKKHSPEVTISSLKETGSGMLGSDLTIAFYYRRKNEASNFCLALILWPPAKVKVTESGIKW